MNTATASFKTFKFKINKAEYHSEFSRRRAQSDIQKRLQCCLMLHLLTLKKGVRKLDGHWMPWLFVCLMNTAVVLHVLWHLHRGIEFFLFSRCTKIAFWSTFLFVLYSEMYFPCANLEKLFLKQYPFTIIYVQYSPATFLKKI